MNKNRADMLRMFLRTWKMATVQQIREIALRGETLTEGAYWHLLYRLRKARCFSSVRFGSEVICFDSSMAKRSSYLRSLKAEERVACKTRFGIEHNLQMVSLAGDLSLGRHLRLQEISIPMRCPPPFRPLVGNKFTTYQTLFAPIHRC